MSFISQLDGLRKLRNAIHSYAPHNDNEELLQPYLGWVARIDQDITRAVKHLQSLGLNPEEIETGLTNSTEDRQWPDDVLDVDDDAPPHQ